jgi:hypothetical protein
VTNRVTGFHQQKHLSVPISRILAVKYDEHVEKLGMSKNMSDPNEYMLLN